MILDVELHSQNKVFILGQRVLGVIILVSISFLVVNFNQGEDDLLVELLVTYLRLGVQDSDADTVKLFWGGLLVEDRIKALER